jgi:hypothetical protein
MRRTTIQRLCRRAANGHPEALPVRVMLVGNSYRVATAELRRVLGLDPERDKAPRQAPKSTSLPPLPQQRIGMDPSRAATQCDDRKAARERLRRLDEHRQVCRELEQLAPLTLYYGPRPLRAIPLTELLEHNWWAA